MPASTSNFYTGQLVQIYAILKRVQTNIYVNPLLVTIMLIMAEINVVQSLIIYATESNAPASTLSYTIFAN